MRPRLTSLEDWEQAALLADAQSGAEASAHAVEWYALALRLRHARRRLKTADSHAYSLTCLPPVAPVYRLPPSASLPIENRLHALFSE